MMVKNWIILGVAVSAILAYTIGIPPSFSAEYTKSAQYTSSANSCGNTEADGTTSTLAATYQSSDYETLVDTTYCANTESQIQGEENSVGLSSSQR